jgi:hypothetical protein
MPFTRGHSGNPGGRPKKGKSLTEALQKAMDRKTAEGKKNYDALADTLVKLAIEDKNITAIKYIMDRVDGRPTETINFGEASLYADLAKAFSAGEEPTKGEEQE